MGWIENRRQRRAAAQVTERIDSVEPPLDVPARRGFDVDAVYNRAAAPSTNGNFGTQHRQDLDDLYAAFVACVPASACVDATARTITSGGLRMVPNDPADSEITGDTQETPTPPPVIQRIERLIAFSNEEEDMLQVVRGVITDLEVAGESFVELVWLLGEPVAMFPLDCATMSVVTDLHGRVINYLQDIDGEHKVTFQPQEVLHFRLDRLRGGTKGLSPGRKALLPITLWVYAMACAKELFRKGDPGTYHVDLGNQSPTDIERWEDRYMSTNLGPRNIGKPIVTSRNGSVNEMQHRKYDDYANAMKDSRDIIATEFGVPPSKIGIIESGNIGGGSGESQERTWRVNKIGPYSEYLIRVIQREIVQKGFGVTDWHIEFGEVDYRDSKVTEEINQERVKSGGWTLNRYRRQIGEPPVPGGDLPILMLRSSVVAWEDIQQMSQATLDKAKGDAKNALDPSALPGGGIARPGPPNASTPGNPNTGQGPKAGVGGPEREKQ